MKKARANTNDYWDKKLLEVEEKDPNRWRHTGYKKMYIEGESSSESDREFNRFYSFVTATENVVSANFKGFQSDSVWSFFLKTNEYSNEQTIVHFRLKKKKWPNK